MQFSNCLLTYPTLLAWVLWSAGGQSNAGGRAPALCCLLTVFPIHKFALIRLTEHALHRQNSLSRSAIGQSSCSPPFTFHNPVMRSHSHRALLQFEPPLLSRTQSYYTAYLASKITCATAKCQVWQQALCPLRWELCVYAFAWAHALARVARAV